MVKHTIEELVLIREPVLDLSEFSVFLQLYHNGMNREFLELVKTNKVILESLLIASESLYSSIQQINKDTSEKKIKKICKSVFKYIIRMANRTTPFGLFTAVSFNRISIKSKKIKYRKIVNIDFSWYMEIVKIIEDDFSLNKDLKIKFSGQVYKTGNKYINPMITNGISRLEKDYIIYSNKFINRVKTFLSTEKTIKELITYLCSYYNDKKEIEDQIKNLIQQEYLITEMRIQLDNDYDLLDFLLNKLQNSTNNILYHNLLSVSESLSKYTNTELGEGEKSYLELLQKMKKIVRTNKYLTVELEGYSRPVNTKETFNSIKDFFDLVSEIYLKTNNREYDGFKEYFLEEFGTDTSVPIVELFNPYSNIKSPDEFNDEKKDYNLGKLISNLSLNAIKNSSKRVVLDSKIICEYYMLDKFNESSKNRLKSFEVAISVFNTEDELITMLSPIKGSGNINSIIGRFNHLLNFEQKNLLNQIYLQENNNKIESVEISELTAFDSISNISKNSNNRKYKVISNQYYDGFRQNIDYSDIFIGIDSKTLNWYMFSRKLGKRIRVCTSNIVNPIYHTNIFRFLTKISQGDSLIDILYELDLNWVYQPEIRFENIILRPETWFFENKGNLSEEMFCSKIKLFFSEWNIPEIVYLNTFTDTFLINTSRQFCDYYLSILYQNYLNSKGLLFSKSEFQDYIFDKEQHHTELILTLTPREKIFKINDQNKQILTISNPEVVTIDNWRKNFSLEKYKYRKNWVSIFLYYNHEDLDSFRSLCGNIYDFISDLFNKKIIQNFNFIRYTDGRYHLRIRLEIVKKFRKDVIYELNLFLQTLLFQSLICDYTINNYKPEINKFGGIKVLPFFETYNTENSLYIIKELLIDYSDKDLLDKIILFLMFILKKFGLSLENQVLFLEDNINGNTPPPEYRIYKNEILSIIDKFNKGECLPSFSTLSNFIDITLLEDKKSCLTNYREKIALHLFHQICNRFGISNESELWIKKILRVGIKDYIQLKKRGLY